MSSELSFWRRVGTAFRISPQHGNGGGSGPALAVESPGPNRANGRGPRGSGLSTLLPWVRRGEALRQMDERYQRVTDLMDALRVHFERQDQRGQELAAGIDRIGQALQQLSETQRVQGEGVASIAARVQDVARYGAGLSSMLAELPAALQAQAESVRTVGREMTMMHQADTQLVGALQQLGGAVESLRDTGTTQVDVLERMHTAGKDEQASVQQFVRSQTRLLLILTIIVSVLGLGIVATLAGVARMAFHS